MMVGSLPNGAAKARIADYRTFGAALSPRGDGRAEHGLHAEHVEKLGVTFLPESARACRSPVSWLR